MQNENNTIDLSRYPLMTIGEIAADLAEGRSVRVADFAKLTGNDYVVVHVEMEAPEEGSFGVKQGLYVSIPGEGDANAFPVHPDVTENELAVAIAASISLGMMLLGAEPDFMFPGGEYEDVMIAMHDAVENRTAATNPDESASILADVVNWLLGQPEVTT